MPAADLRHFCELFAATQRTVTLFSQGINQSTAGTDQVNGINNLHLATGRIGKAGSAPFSITGQPNAIGGRELAGPASTLSPHMDLPRESSTGDQRFRAATPIDPQPGRKADEQFPATSQT